MLHIILSALVVFLVGASEGATSEYYWRSWNGTVPSDAIVAGADGRGPYYIAKAWLPDYGIYIGQVFSGQTTVSISYSTAGNLVATSNTVDVLCGKNKQAIWYASNTSRTPQLIDGTLINPVLGGRTSYYALNPIYIGRVISTGGDSYLGSVHTDYYLYFVNANGVAQYSTSYDLLVLEDVPGANSYAFTIEDVSKNSKKET